MVDAVAQSFPVAGNVGVLREIFGDQRRADHRIAKLTESLRCMIQDLGVASTTPELTFQPDDLKKMLPIVGNFKKSVHLLDDRFTSFSTEGLKNEFKTLAITHRNALSKRVDCDTREMAWLREIHKTDPATYGVLKAMAGGMNVASYEEKALTAVMESSDSNEGAKHIREQLNTMLTVLLGSLQLVTKKTESQLKYTATCYIINATSAATKRRVNGSSLEEMVQSIIAHVVNVAFESARHKRITIVPPTSDGVTFTDKVFDQFFTTLVLNFYKAIGPTLKNVRDAIVNNLQMLLRGVSSIDAVEDVNGMLAQVSEMMQQLVTTLERRTLTTDAYSDELVMYLRRTGNLYKIQLPQAVEWRGVLTSRTNVTRPVGILGRSSCSSLPSLPSPGQHRYVTRPYRGALSIVGALLQLEDQEYTPMMGDPKVFTAEHQAGRLHDLWCPVIHRSHDTDGALLVGNDDETKTLAMMHVISRLIDFPVVVVAADLIYISTNAAGPDKPVMAVWVWVTHDTVHVVHPLHV